jgi:hemoglobin
MISRHLDRHLTQPERAQWVRLLLEAGDEVRLPDDPEFRSALVAYLEWGSRLAVINSQPGASVRTRRRRCRVGVGACRAVPTATEDPCCDLLRA